MGSLPSQCNQTQSPTIKIQDLATIFSNQQHQINNFFNNLDLNQALIFAQTLLDAQGAIFFSGVGKSGQIALKLSQTLASLSFRSSFLSPVDALHGDIGAIFPSDLLVIISKSGSSAEVLDLVPCARAKGAILIGVTCARGSLLEKVCDFSVCLVVEEEVCPLGLAPVTSAAVQMLFGDTVIAGIMRAKGISKEEYGRNHPAGRIGKSLIFKVKDLMKKLEDLPLCKEGDMIMDKLTELNSKGCGCLLVINDENHLIGTFTDGDLRRTLKSYGEFIFKLTVGEMCNRNPRTIKAEAMAVEAMQKMESPPSAVQFLPVVDDQNVVIGIITLHGLVSAGL